MPLMTYTEQLASHAKFLRDLGLDVDIPKVDMGLVRCKALHPEPGKCSEYAYTTSRNPMKKADRVGLITWCRGYNGVEKTHNTYGLGGSSEGYLLAPSTANKPQLEARKSSEAIIQNCRKWWDSAHEHGSSPYLEKKNVGTYGVRFYNNGTVLVPARDVHGVLLAVQFLNADGRKRFPAGAVSTGLFHELRTPVNGQILGIAESYTTAATCMELAGISMVCSFGSSNLTAVAEALRKKYPDSRMMICADNDRHLQKNKGIDCAEGACSLIGNACVAVPDFGNLSAGRDASDWNDLARLIGDDAVKAQLQVFIPV